MRLPKFVPVIFILGFPVVQARPQSFQSLSLFSMKERELFRNAANLFQSEKLEQSGRNMENLNSNIKNITLFNGDMVLNAEQQKIFRNSKRTVSSLRNIFYCLFIQKKRQAYRDRFYPSTIWQNGVPFTFDDNLPSAAVKSLQRAMDFWAAETCIKFRERTDETTYIYYTGEENGCFSAVGRQGQLEPKQHVNIGPGCYNFGVTTHEIAHALGVFHHQQRSDRDDFVTFIEQNVGILQQDNFLVIPDQFLTTYDTPYDIGSVMHYTPTEFALNKNFAALVAKDLLLQPTMGSMDEPSFVDVLLLNRHYNCNESCVSTTSPNCLNGGYQDPNNCEICKCPSGFGGTRCQRIEHSDLKCGGLLPATYELQRIKITLSAGENRKKCVYQIRAPKGRKVMVGVEQVKGKCQEGCYTTGVELKMKSDFQPVGYRVCCIAHSFRRMLSESATAPVTFFAQDGTLEATLFYRWVVDSPAAEDTTDITADEMKEIFVQKNQDVDFQVLSSAPNVFHNEIDPEILVYGSDGTSYTDFSSPAQ